MLGSDRFGLLERLDDAAYGSLAVLGLSGELELDEAGILPFDARTTTSDGPAGRSIATSRDTASFASFTYALPGPTIRSTRSTYASHAIACAPPSAHVSSMPSASAAAATSPAPDGGVTTTIRSTPAACAGTAHMTSVETRPRGT